MLDAPLSTASPEPSSPRKANKVHKVVHRIHSALKRVGSTATTFSPRASNNIDKAQDHSVSFSFTDAALIYMDKVLTRRQASRVVGRIIHRPEDVSYRIVRMLRGRNFGCHVSCTTKKWAKAFKMRAVSLKRIENSVLVVRIVVHQNNRDAVGHRTRKTGSTVNIYPAKVGGFKNADPDGDALAIAHFHEFVESVEHAFSTEYFE